MISQPKRRWLAASVAVAGSMALAGCASSPPTSELRGANDAIARAQYDGASQLAPQPFQTAQEKLAAAQNNVQADNMDQAKNLAQEAAADADFADAISNSAKTAAAASELQAVQQKLQGKLQ